MSTHTYIQDVRNQNIKIYINGEIFSRKDAKISVFDSGFLLGDGVWEGIRLHNGHLVFEKEHFDRLYHCARKLDINVGIPKSEIKTLVHSLIKVNKMTSDIHIRLIISRGLKHTPYQHPKANVGGASIVIIPEYKKADKTINENGITLATVSTRRGTAETQDPRLNTLSKLNCIFACIEADKLGADEGLMLDVNGNVSTCNSTNFFIVKNDEVWTSTGEFCLPGITRKKIIQLCKTNKISVYEKNFIVDDILNADEAFVTGTFSGVIPVIFLDKKMINNGKRGKMTKRLFDLYKSEINKLYPSK